MKGDIRPLPTRTHLPVGWLRRVAVVGAGTAGLATASLLKRRGIHVEVFEEAPSPGPIGAGILLQPTGLAVLAAMGLADDLLALGSVVRRLYGESVSGTRVMDMQYADWRADALGLGIHRGQLFGTLYAACKNSGAVFHLNARVTRVDPGTGDVHVGDDVYCGFDLVVIANGTGSELRDELFGQSYSDPYPWGAYWAITSAEHCEPDVLAQRYRRCDRMVGLLPSGMSPVTGQPCVSFFFSVPVAEAGQWSFDRIMTETLSIWPEAEKTVATISADELMLARYGDVWLPCDHIGRAVMIGDASHGMSPQLGMGANLAMLDAWALDLALEQPGHERADRATCLAHYNRLRRQHQRFNRWMSWALTPLFQSQSMTLAWLRDLTFPASRWLSPTRALALRTLCGTMFLNRRLARSIGLLGDRHDK